MIHEKKHQWSPEERELRIKLAAAYRLFEQYGWSEIIYDHLTAKIPGIAKSIFPSNIEENTRNEPFSY